MLPDPPFIKPLLLLNLDPCQGALGSLQFFLEHSNFKSIIPNADFKMFLEVAN